MAGARKRSYLAAAFMAPANLFALASAGISSALLTNPLPGLVALGAEVLYLGGMALSPKFRRQIRAQAQAADEEGEAEVLLEELAPSQREHYFGLRELRDRILANYRKLPGGGVLAASSESRLDALLTNFLRLLTTLNAYRKYLGAADRAALEREMKELEEEARWISRLGEPKPGAERKNGENERLREVKQRRADILRQRLDRFQQADDSRELVSHQLAHIEDLMRLTHEQSIAIRDPDSITRQLDTLAGEVETTAETVRELERFIEIDEELRGGSVPDRVRS